ncbi:MAG: hypothetical protein IKS54_07925 [Erysipelotrichaceae bacterium]|nr:hypothetical protein [Erysipelotrichaceae bacterium]
MKKLFSVLLISILLCGCMSQREDYYIFSFDDFTITPGYDNVEFMKLIFDVDLPDRLSAGETLKDQDVFFWNSYFADIDVTNQKKEEIRINEAVVSRLIFYLSNYPASVYKIGNIELSESVKENCRIFEGEYIERNGYACAFGKKSAGKNNVVILYGDIFGIDQDKLDHVEIYVE